ncbi:hypothetical protein GCM10010145_44920 [Streptomyces ruber]|uniref:Uncharacterized protein n=2 Tax=Streptomyces TaxID=1883 RepID=A0A918EUK7_9ACTN|nr:hypothetical protein [Streptomyces ruber]GGQ70371.1 hypothetical protein GCM10010145_44920 [Streptomyces ruber]
MSTPAESGPPPSPSPPAAPPPPGPAPQDSPPGRTPAPPGTGDKPASDGRGAQKAGPSGSAGAGAAAGPGAGDDTARPGEGSIRAELLREAWTNIGGDHVQGDKFVFHTEGQQPILRTLPDGVIESARHAFQPPPRWEDIQADAWHRRSVVLRGPGGAGKTTAAVRLLIAAGARAYYQLDSVAELTGSTDPSRFDEGAGLLLDDPRDLGELRGSHLTGLEDLLERADAHVVLIAGPDAELDHSVGEYVQRVARPDALDAVLAAHLAHRLGEEEAERVLAADGVAGLADELLAGAACRDAARLAEVLAHEYRAGGDLGLDLDRVRTRMDRTGGEPPEEWFEGLGDTVLRTHAVALAALNGLPREDVAMAASRLLERFRTERGVLATSVEQGPVPLRQDPFARSGRSLAEQLRFRTVDRMVWDHHGWVPCTVAEYRDRDYPRRIIQHVWSEYRVQRELVDWLAELVDSPLLRVRSFAGTALGLIAAASFDHIVYRVFPGWIVHERNGNRRREAIAYALSVCARYRRLLSGVRDLVGYWYTSGRWQEQAAAARAYGSCLGGADLGTALQALTRLATVNHVQVAVAIGDACADLVADDVAEHAPAVLRAVAEMVHEPSSRPQGHLIFLRLADSLVDVEEPATAGTTPRCNRPSLLQLAADSDPGGEQRRLLGYLWSEALGGEQHADLAAAVLERWAAQAENDPLLLDELVRFLAEDVAARSPRAGRLLRWYTVRWTEPDHLRHLPRSAAVLAEALRGSENAAPARSGGAR